MFNNDAHRGLNPDSTPESGKGRSASASRGRLRRVLIAEDDSVSRKVLESFLTRWGYEVVVTRDGAEARAILQAVDAPHLILLDWMMPSLGGLELCQWIRKSETPMPAYIVLVTSRAGREDIVSGLDAGANDYIAKPFDQAELRARVQAGARTIDLQLDLAERVRELESALANVKKLQGLLPICSYCKKIRNDNNYWQKVETYLTENTDAAFSHGICPDCFDKIVRPGLEKSHEEGEAGRD